MTYYALFVISIADRVVDIAGIAMQPDEAWMLRVARNLMDEEGGALASKRNLIVDRDTKHMEQFRILEDGGGVVMTHYRVIGELRPEY